MLADARRAHEVGIPKATIVNRLYYARSHAARAALYARGFDPQSHRSVRTLLGRELIETGAVPRERGRFLNDVETYCRNDVETYRRRVDYGSGGVERETEDLLEETTAFLDAMREATDTDGDGTSG